MSGESPTNHGVRVFDGHWSRPGIPFRRVSRTPE